MHYMNSREAKVGDPVVGKTYNRPGIVSGTLVSLTPGPDSCLAKVGFLSTKVISSIENNFYEISCKSSVKIQGTEQHGASGELAITFYEEDYTEAKNLLHAEDVVFEEAAKKIK